MCSLDFFPPTNIEKFIFLLTAEGRQIEVDWVMWHIWIWVCYCKRDTNLLSLISWIFWAILVVWDICSWLWDLGFNFYGWPLLWCFWDFQRKEKSKGCQRSSRYICLWLLDTGVIYVIETLWDWNYLVIHNFHLDNYRAFRCPSQ